MPTPKGSHLYVNVGPSEVRRRLKGFGHGVRKVQSAGRHQAVIIHTATGQHLTDLEAKFADDVGFSESVSDLSTQLRTCGILGQRVLPGCERSALGQLANSIAWVPSGCGIG